MNSKLAENQATPTQTHGDGTQFDFRRGRVHRFKTWDEANAFHDAFEQHLKDKGLLQTSGARQH